VCEPTALVIASGVLQGAGQINEHAEARRGVSRRNRSRLRQFDYENEQYLTDVMLNNAEWKNDVQVQDIEQDDIYKSMIDQWTQQDQQLDKIFAQGDQKIENAIIQMYENDYAGTQTGRTAARLAGKSAKKMGQEKAEILYDMMMSSEEAAVNKEILRNEADRKSRLTWEKIRFSPIHGPTPIAPELEAMPSSAGLILGLLSTAVSTVIGVKGATPTKVSSNVANTGSGATGGFGLGTYGSGMPSNPAYVGVGANPGFVGSQYSMAPAQTFMPSANLGIADWIQNPYLQNTGVPDAMRSVLQPPINTARALNDPFLAAAGIPA
tara:strand:- start:783 stop:1751 length:969 start_codon:yes stop_codon:yes gene_type:complete